MTREASSIYNIYVHIIHTRSTCVPRLIQQEEDEENMGTWRRRRGRGDLGGEEDPGGREHLEGRWAARIQEVVFGR